MNSLSSSFSVIRSQRSHFCQHKKCCVIVLSETFLCQNEANSLGLTEYIFFGRKIKEIRNQMTVKSSSYLQADSGINQKCWEFLRPFPWIRLQLKFQIPSRWTTPLTHSQLIMAIADLIFYADNRILMREFVIVFATTNHLSHELYTRPNGLNRFSLLWNRIQRPTLNCKSTWIPSITSFTSSAKCIIKHSQSLWTIVSFQRVYN